MHGEIGVRYGRKAATLRAPVPRANLRQLRSSGKRHRPALPFCASRTRAQRVHPLSHILYCPARSLMQTGDPHFGVGIGIGMGCLRNDANAWQARTESPCRLQESRVMSLACREPGSLESESPCCMAGDVPCAPCHVTSGSCVERRPSRPDTDRRKLGRSFCDPRRPDTRLDRSTVFAWPARLFFCLQPQAVAVTPAS
jgi:hypothetical protein